jgi:hypothetical protein
MAQVTIALLLIAGIAFDIIAQPTNHALLIGVDNYKTSDIWSSSVPLKNNIDSAMLFLSQSNFRFDTSYLRNQHVVIDSIRSRFSKLKIKPGDRLFIYFNGHGAQVDDLNGDEKDHKDEVFVCYDAPSSKSDDFRLKCLVDDELHDLVGKVRKKMGTSGQVFILAESCHSSTLDKSGIENHSVSRGGWQSAFLSEKADTDSAGFAPLILFSSSRASDQTASFYHFSRYFFSVFRDFTGGSYHDLFDQFYQKQRTDLHAELGTDVDVSQTVNVSVEDPDYLRLGVFEDSVYNLDHSLRVIAIEKNGSSSKRRVQINSGLYAGITLGSMAEFSIPPKKYTGEVDFVSNGSSWLTVASPPSEKELWSAHVAITDYKFQAVLNLNLDETILDAQRKQIETAARLLSFVKIGNKTDDGYTLTSVKNRGLFVIRNRDEVGVYKADDDIRSTMLKMQISTFIRKLTMQRDTTNLLTIRNGPAKLSTFDLTHVKKGDQLTLILKPLIRSNQKYYAVLQMEDEFVKQLVPVNFQINDSECKLPEPGKEILLGNVTVGAMDGKFLLLTSSSPLDLRGVLLKPLVWKRDPAKLNEIEHLVDDLFLTRSNKAGLHSTDDILVFDISYRIDE